MSKEINNDSKPLDAADMLILNMIKDDPDIKQAEIARRMKRTPQAISKRMRRAKMREAVIEVRGTVDEIIGQAKTLAAKRMKRLILSKDENIALKASTSVLKADLSPVNETPQGSNEIRFVTVVNDVGVLESRPSAIEGEVIENKDE